MLKTCDVHIICHFTFTSTYPLLAALVQNISLNYVQKISSFVRKLITLKYIFDFGIFLVFSYFGTKTDLRYINKTNDYHGNAVLEILFMYQAVFVGIFNKTQTIF